MDIHEKRSKLIVETMAQVEQLVKDGAELETLNSAKDVLAALATQRDLFPESDFPWPEETNGNSTWCLYSGANDCALYLDLLNHGASTVPHDHGSSWAIVTGIEGQETHRLYQRVDAGIGAGPAKLEQVGELTIGVGDSVSMLNNGIHAIEAVGTERIMMLHCYGKGFEHQSDRLEYNMHVGTCAYSVDAAGEIRDFPLHPAAV